MGGRASSEDRTRDLALTKRMLCQLSYRGEHTARWARARRVRQRAVGGPRKPAPGGRGVLAQSEACVLSKDEVLGSKPRYSIFGFAAVGMV